MKCRKNSSHMGGREGGREEFLKNGYPLLTKRVKNVLLNWRSSSFP